MNGIKKHKDIETLGWTELLGKIPTCPEGYSTYEEICKKTGLAHTTVRNKLKKLGVKSIQGRNPQGHIVTYFKD